MYIRHVQNTQYNSTVKANDNEYNNVYLKLEAEKERVKSK